MLGQVVWRYTIPFTGTTGPSVTGVMVLPGSNDVLYTVINPESQRGAYEVNRAGQLVWSYVNKTISHDVVRLPNGDTLLTAAHSEDYGVWPYTYPEVFEVNQQGKVVWQWHASADYANNPKDANVRTTDFGYWTHVNEALRLPDGTTMISIRNFNLTVIVDSAGAVLKSFGDPCSRTCPPFGYILEPHSPIPLSNGHYLINSPGPGRVYEFDASANTAVWQWPALGTQSSTPNLRGSQRLPNGNTLICDSSGQMLEIAPDGTTVWTMRVANYWTGKGVSGAPFFQAERLSYMPPGFILASPSNKATYTGNTVPLSFTAGVDLGNATYSIRNNSNNTWIVRNASLVKNLYKDFLTAPTVVNGPSSLSLTNGNYTLRVLAGSTGSGYKAYVQQKRINYASQDVTFVVNSQAATTTSTTTSSRSTTTTTNIPEFVTPVVVPVLVVSFLMTLVLLRLKGQRFGPRAAAWRNQTL